MLDFKNSTDHVIDNRQIDNTQRDEDFFRQLISSGFF